MLHRSGHFCAEDSASGFWFEENVVCGFDTLILGIILNTLTCSSFNLLLTGKFLLFSCIRNTFLNAYLRR